MFRGLGIPLANDPLRFQAFIFFTAHPEPKSAAHIDHIHDEMTVGKKFRVMRFEFSPARSLSRLFKFRGRQNFKVHSAIGVFSVYGISYLLGVGGHGRVLNLEMAKIGVVFLVLFPTMWEIREYIFGT